MIFGLPGGGISGIMEALRIRQEKIRFVQVGHEEAATAAFMACAYSKYTGKPGASCEPPLPGKITIEHAEPLIRGGGRVATKSR